MQAPNFPMAALRFLMVMLGRAVVGCGRALHALAMVLGRQPALTRDPAIGAWQNLSRRRRVRRPRPSGPRRVIPLHGSVDDPHVQLRITM
jgi:hypothetical protein